MAVMLSKIFILLAGQPSETSSFLADMESEKKERKKERGCGCEGASIIEVPGCYQFIQGQYGGFQFVLVSRQRFPHVWLALSVSLPRYLSRTVTGINVLAALRHTACYTVFGFVLNCTAIPLKLGCMMLQDMTLPLAT